MSDHVRVFVSHHHSPEEDVFTAQLVSSLKGAGADVWVDTEGIPSGDFVRKINEGLAGRQWLVLVMTPGALRSPWVQGEVDAAYHQVKIGRMLGIVPIVAIPCDEHEVPLLWANLQRYDATRDYQSALAGLLHALSLHPVPSSISAPVAPRIPQPSTLRPLGTAPAPEGATPAQHLTPASLHNLGFRGWTVGGVACVLPPVCPVPNGVFTMGSDKAHDKAAHDNETPQFRVPVGDFYIGQYPVTVAEYACAVRAGAVSAPSNPLFVINWQKQLTRLDHPVVFISWQEATAYIRWLAGLTGQPWRLPTEAEWEKMARWDARTGQSRIYPWGETFEKARCNSLGISDIGDILGATTPVGRYPTGASPYGAQDVAGSVWEWTSSLFKPYPYNQNDRREDQKSSENRVLRGGSWNGSARYARAAFRGSLSPNGLFVGDYGFRLALSPVRASSA